MRELKLSDGSIALVDEDDFERASARQWNASRNRNVTYARSGDTYLHRFILSAPKGSIVDHINGNGLDNRKENLRLANHQMNKANGRKDNKTSKYIGVSFESRLKNRPYRVMVKIDGRNVHLGSYATEIEAAKEYDKVALARFGGAAKLNFE